MGNIFSACAPRSVKSSNGRSPKSNKLPEPRSVTQRNTSYTSPLWGSATGLKPVPHTSYTPPAPGGVKSSQPIAHTSNKPSVPSSITSPQPVPNTSYTSPFRGSATDLKPVPYTSYRPPTPPIVKSSRPIAHTSNKPPVPSSVTSPQPVPNTSYTSPFRGSATDLKPVPYTSYRPPTPGSVKSSQPIAHTSNKPPVPSSVMSPKPVPHTSYTSSLPSSVMSPKPVSLKKNKLTVSGRATMLPPLVSLSEVPRRVTRSQPVPGKRFSSPVLNDATSFRSLSNGRNPFLDIFISVPTISYTNNLGEVVSLYEPFNPWQELGLPTTTASFQDVKQAFKTKIAQSNNRQSRAVASIASHILTSKDSGFERQPGTDNYNLKRRDHFVLAACGHTSELVSKLSSGGKDLLKDTCEGGRTLLHIASASGYYDTCKMLLDEGASVNDVQEDGSTPLHGAAYFSHTQVVKLLVESGARGDVRNKFGKTPFDESATLEIRRLIHLRTRFKAKPDSLPKIASCNIKLEGSQAKGDEIKNQDTSQDRCVIEYTAAGGDKVAIHEPINPWKILGLQSSNASRQEIKAAFRQKITQSRRQDRTLVSMANHILSATADRYTQKPGTDEFLVKRRDHFMLAASGHTKALATSIAASDSDLLKKADEHGRTLLYLASKSGFYDMCKMLLERGASVNEVQQDGSTPLHAAAYFGHALVVGLLLEHGARSDVRNKWGSTALEESATPETRSVIQSALTDRIASLVAKFMEKKLVGNVRVVEHEGKVIAKELLRDSCTLDVNTRAQWNFIQNTWELVWHGTRYNCLESIMQNGLMPAGSNGITPSKGHYRLGEEHFGIANWAAAIFLSPSILYAAHACYSDRVLSESEQWCVLVKAYCKPGCYKSYDPTVFSYKPMDGEPVMPEYRVPVNGEDKHVILRVESRRSVVVQSVIFVRLSFLESKDINFEKAIKLLR